MATSESKALRSSSSGALNFPRVPFQTTGRSSSVDDLIIPKSCKQGRASSISSQVFPKAPSTSHSASSTSPAKPTILNSEIIWKHGTAKEANSQLSYSHSGSFVPPQDLKERVERAIKVVDNLGKVSKEHKVFMVNVRYRAIRQALERRGWVQKFNNAGTIPDTMMSPIGEERQYQAKINKALKTWMEEKLRDHPPDLIWRFGYDKFGWKDIQPHQLVNYFSSCHLCPKLELIERIHELQWYSQQDLAYTFFPRSYILSIPEEKSAFVGDYCLTACVNLLQWFVGTVEECGERGVLTSAGGLSPVCFHFAISQVRTYISIRCHNDIDWPTSQPMALNEGWKVFLNQCFDIVYGVKKLTLGEGPRDTFRDLYDTCKLGLKAIAPYWPQMYIDGTFNMWICKPGRGSQGQGILMMNDLDRILGLYPDATLPDKKSWVIQKYVERPLLVYNSKCDFRQWILVTDWRPLRVWFYKEAYFRFSSKPFRVNRLGNSSHILNTQVQGTFEVSDSRDPRLPEDSMWDTSEFVDYLKQKGKAETWRKKTYPEIKRSILSILFACQDKVGLEYRKNSFQVYGADFIISGDMVPWLLEINSVPFMGTTRRVTKRLVPQFLEDVVKVIVDRRRNPSASIGSFEVLYRGLNSPIDNLPPQAPYVKVVGKKIQSSQSLESLHSDTTMVAGSNSIQAMRKAASNKTLNGADMIMQDISRRMTLKEISSRSFTTFEDEPRLENDSGWDDALSSLADRFRALESKLLSRTNHKPIPSKSTLGSQRHVKADEDDAVEPEELATSNSDQNLDEQQQGSKKSEETSPTNSVIIVPKKAVTGVSKSVTKLRPLRPLASSHAQRPATIETTSLRSSLSRSPARRLKQLESTVVIMENMKRKQSLAKPTYSVNSSSSKSASRVSTQRNIVSLQNSRSPQRMNPFKPITPVKNRILTPISLQIMSSTWLKANEALSEAEALRLRKQPSSMVSRKSGAGKQLISHSTPGGSRTTKKEKDKEKVIGKQVSTASTETDPLKHLKTKSKASILNAIGRFRGMNKSKNIQGNK